MDRKPLDNSYNAYCKNPKCVSRIHRTNTTGWCPDCWSRREYIEMEMRLDDLSKEEKPEVIEDEEETGNVTEDVGVVELPLPQRKRYVWIIGDQILESDDRINWSVVDPKEMIMKEVWSGPREKPEMKTEITEGNPVEFKPGIVKELFEISDDGTGNIKVSEEFARNFKESVTPIKVNRTVYRTKYMLDVCPYCNNTLQSTTDKNRFECVMCNTTVKLVDSLEVHPLQRLMADGKTASTPTYDYHLIPTIALQRLAERFSLGERRKKDKAWNALSNNQDALLDLSWAIERISHVIDHATKLRDKLGAKDINGILADDDAAAIAWAGCFLICVTDKLCASSQEE